MKTTFIYIFALFCLTSIQCSSWTWKQCDGFGDFSWQTTNVTLDQPPVIGQNVTATICEMNPTWFVWGTSEVLISPAPEVFKTFYVEEKVNLVQGESHCWHLTFPIPEEVPQTLKVETRFQDLYVASGCAELHFDFSSSEKKFLSF